MEQNSKNDHIVIEVPQDSNLTMKIEDKPQVMPIDIYKQLSEHGANNTMYKLNETTLHQYQNRMPSKKLYSSPIPLEIPKNNEGLHQEEGSDISDSSDLMSDISSNANSVNTSDTSHKHNRLHKMLYKLGTETVEVSYKKLTYVEVLQKIDRDYQPSLPHQASSSLDIIASYLKGQRTMYMEAMSFLRSQLNWLMLPAIIMSAVCSVLSQGTFDNNTLGQNILSGLNVTVACLIAIINYLKLDAAAEAHKTTAHRYDKILTSIEFTSGETLLVHDTALDRFSNRELKDPQQYLLGFSDVTLQDISGADLNLLARQRHYRNVRRAKKELTDKLKEQIHQLGERISEVKDTNQFIIPKAIRSRYPLLQTINVFAIIKKIEDYKAHQITKLKNIKNEIRVVTQAGLKARKADNRELASARRKTLQARKTTTINVILYLNTAFMMVERMFLQEMINAESKQKHRIRFFLNNLLTSILCCVGWNVCLPRQFMSPEKAGGPILLKLLGLRMEGDTNELTKEARELLIHLNDKNVKDIESFNRWLRFERKRINKNKVQFNNHSNTCFPFSSINANRKVSIYEPTKTHYLEEEEIEEIYPPEMPPTPFRRKKLKSRPSGQLQVNEQSSDREEDSDI